MPAITPTAAAKIPIAARDDPLAHRLAAAVIRRAAAGASPSDPTALRPTLARVPTSAKWLADSDSGRFRRRSPALVMIDAAVGQYEDAIDDAAKDAALHDIEAAIYHWWEKKGGATEAGKTARGNQVRILKNAVDAAQVRAALAASRHKIDRAGAWLLEPLPVGSEASEVFDRFMNYFRGRHDVEYTLSTRHRNRPWDNFGTPIRYACGTFAMELAEYAKVMRLEARPVAATSRNFVTKVFSPARFIDSTAPGNVEIRGVRVLRYFFTEHYVTEITDRDGSIKFFCPTSGLALASLAATELVDEGDLVRTADGYAARGVTVTRKSVGGHPVVERGGSVYEVELP